MKLGLFLALYGDSTFEQALDKAHAAGVEAAILERDGKIAIRYRALTEPEIRSALGD